MAVISRDCRSIEELRQRVAARDQQGTHSCSVNETQQTGRCDPRNGGDDTYVWQIREG